MRLEHHSNIHILTEPFPLICLRDTIFRILGWWLNCWAGLVPQLLRG